MVGSSKNIPNIVLHILSASRYNNKIILVIMSIVIAALVVDTSLIKISNLLSNQSYYGWRISLFIVIAAVYMVGQYLVLGFVRQKSKEIRIEAPYLNIINKIVAIAQCVLTAIILLVILQIVVMSRYNVATLTAATAISYMLAIAMMVLLAQRFFLWFKLRKDSVILLYSLSSATLAINAGFTLVFVTVILMAEPAEARPHIGTSFPAFEPGSVIDMLNYGYVVSSIISFMLMWAATALLLNYYSQKLGKVKYWIILLIPLVYFLSQFVALFVNLFAPLLKSDPIFFSILLTLIFTVSKPAGGILFGVAFWTMARSIRHNRTVRDYMTISAYGLVLLFIPNQAIVMAAAPYPPFGLSAISFMGLSAYLILVGIYSSAISVSHDVDLRKSIRRFAIKESKLLDSIGSAEMEQQIVRISMVMAKRRQHTMTEESGVQSSLNDDDIKQYVTKVLNEVKGKKEDI
jgi:hypothetical protein